MPQDAILKNVMTFVSMTALPLALWTASAEARGVGVGHQSRVQDVRSVGRATNSPKDFPEMASQADDAIVAERAQIKVLASEAGSLLDDLRLQLAAQPNATLSIRWLLTLPTEAK
ncbi:MAG: hypothetical protein ACREYF_01910 [Gammaproteobacteria bacterium]